MFNWAVKFSHKDMSHEDKMDPVDLFTSPHAHPLF